jgi:hypothetical protein
MRRFLTLWLTLLAAYWLTGALVSAALFEWVTWDRSAIARLVGIPLLQAALVSWLGGRRQENRPED